MAFQQEQQLSGIDWGQIWNGIQTGAQWITHAGGAVQQAGNQVSNAGNNLQNLTAWRIDGKTVVLGAAVVGALFYATRRRNPRGRRVRRHARRR